jgi:hypothetical protein
MDIFGDFFKTSNYHFSRKSKTELTRARVPQILTSLYLFFLNKNSWLFLATRCRTHKKDLTRTVHTWMAHIPIQIIREVVETNPILKLDQSDSTSQSWTLVMLGHTAMEELTFGNKLVGAAPDFSCFVLCFFSTVLFVGGRGVS